MSVLLNQTQFEIHSAGACTEQGFEANPLPWQAPAPPPMPPPLSVSEADALVGVMFDSDTGNLQRVESINGAGFALKVARRRLNAELVLVALRQPVLVNGVPAPSLAVLSVGDSVVLRPGHLAHVTERISPYVGPPVGDLIGKKCAHCRIPARAESRIVTHRCGVIYHYETEETHPHLSKDDRLNCFEKLGTCLSCKRELTLHPYLAWDPRNL